MNGQDCEQLTLFLEDSPASRLVLPGSDEAQKMTVTSGQKCLELYKNSSPVGLLAKMLLESSTWRSTRCYLTWKISATPAKRLLFRLVPSMPRTGETDARLSGVERWKANIMGEDGEPIMWKTPIASDSANREFYHNSRGEPNLSGMVKLWPTPRVGGSMGSSPSGVKHGDLGAVAALYPTPTARDYKGARKPETLGAVGRTERNSLPDYVASLYPTPTTGAGMCGGTGNFQQLKRLKEQGQITEEERRNMSQGNGGQLNPTWVEWLMGFPIGWTDLNASETP